MTTRNGCPGLVSGSGQRESVEEGEEGIIKRTMGWKRKVVTNYCRLRGGKVIGGARRGMWPRLSVQDVK